MNPLLFEVGHLEKSFNKCKIMLPLIIKVSFMKKILTLFVLIGTINAQESDILKSRYGSREFDEFPFDYDKTEKSFTKIPALLKSSIANSNPEFVSATSDSVYEDSTYLFNVLTNDPDANSVSVSVTSNPSWLSLTAKEGGRIHDITKNNLGYLYEDIPLTNWGDIIAYDIDFDSKGNLYFSLDSPGACVIKVSSNGNHSTYAGSTGEYGYSGDGGSATSALFNGITSIKFDDSDNLIIADQFNNRIRKVDVNGIVTTIAGTGEAGYSGDNGKATDAKIKYPQSLDIDSSGNIYFQDRYNNRIRKIDTNGIITAVTGNMINTTTFSFTYTIAADTIWHGYHMTSGESHSTISNPNFVIAEDLNKDGNMDVIVSNSSDKIVWYKNDGYGLFTEFSISNAGTKSITVKDIDSDGDLDLITSGGNLSWYKNDGSQNFSKTTIIESTTAHYVHALDLDNDGDIDIFTSIDNGVVWSLNDGSQNFTSTTYDTDNTDRSFPIDIDKDGDYDFFSGKGWYENNGSQNFTFRSVLNVAAKDFYGIDIDNDNDVDGIFSYNDNVILLKNGGSQNFSLDTLYTFDVGALGGDIVDLSFADIDDDGLVDIFPQRSTTGPKYLKNKGGNVFSANGISSSGRYLSINDMDGDGDLDIILAGKTNYQYTYITWLPNSLIDKASNYELGSMVDIAIGPGDNLYFSQYDKNIISKIENNGTIVTVAGIYPGVIDKSTIWGYSGDGGAATSAKLFNPRSLNFDSSGNLYIGATSIIRKVNTDGIISTIAGTPESSGYSGDGGAATSALLNETIMAEEILDDGTIYFIDYNNRRIRKIDTNGIITNFAGGTAYLPESAQAINIRLKNPRGIAMDSNDNLYIAEQGTHTIRKIDKSGTITVVAGTGTLGSSGDGGLATSGQIYSPRSVTADNNGNIYISDSGNDRIRKVDTNGIISTYAGTGESGYSGDGGAATSAKINFPYHLTTDQDGNLYFAEYSNHIIRKVDTNGIITTVAGTPENGGYSGDGGAATSAKLNRPLGVDIDLSGNIYIADYYNHVIRKVNTDGIISTIAGTPESSGYTGDGDVATSAKLYRPVSVHVDNVGNIYINDRYNYAIRKVWKSGIITTIAGTGTSGYSASDSIAVSTSLSASWGTAIDNLNNVYISDYSVDIIRKIDASYHTLTGIPTNSDVGTTTMTLTASDGQGGSATQSFALKVINTNDAPVLTSVTNVTTNEDTAKTVTLSATDVDGDALTYTGKSNTDKVTISISSTTMTLTPAANWNGVASITAYVSDGTVKDSTSFTFTVASISDVAAINTTTIEEDASATVTLSSTFSGTPTYSAKSDTSAITVSVSSTTLQLTPSSNWNGTSTITAYASVGTFKDSTTFTLSVTPVNDAPVITAVSNDSTDEEVEKSIKLSASDVDGDALTYTASSDTSAVAVTISTDTLKLTPALNYTGTSVITVIVSDNALADTTKFDFKVINVNDAPVIVAVANDTTSEDSDGKALKLSASDIDGDALTYSAFSDTLGLTVTVSNDTVRLKPVADYFGTSKVTAVTNDGAIKDSTTFSFTVLNVQDAPYAFDWVSTASDTIDITKDAANLAEVYKLEWTESIDVDGDTIDYLLYAKIGVLEPDEIYDTTSTSIPITYQEFLENVFEPFPMLPRVTVQFSMEATDGIDTVKITGDNRVLFINRYEYLSTVSEGIPTEFALHENYPNPFNPTTTLRFDLPELSDMTLIIYNMLGQKVKTFSMQSIPAGYHSVTWDATNDLGVQVGAGVYLYQLQAKDFVKTRKMVLLK